MIVITTIIIIIIINHNNSNNNDRNHNNNHNSHNNGYGFWRLLGFGDPGPLAWDIDQQSSGGGLGFRGLGFRGLGFRVGGALESDGFAFGRPFLLGV